jgi:hypothetical protein
MRVRVTPYRDGQNAIRDAHFNAIVSMPPEAKDLPWLMEQLVAWTSQNNDLPVPPHGWHCTLSIRHHPRLLRRKRTNGAVADHSDPAPGNLG